MTHSLITTSVTTSPQLSLLQLLPPVMRSETVSLRTRPVSVSQTKKIDPGLGLAGLLMCCETRSCYARRHNDLEGHNFSSSLLFIVSLFCAWNVTAVEINSGVYQLKS